MNAVAFCQDEPWVPPRGILFRFPLSKSRYLAGLQCHKRLYLEIHSPDLAGETDEELEARREMGIQNKEFENLRPVTYKPSSNPLALVLLLPRFSSTSSRFRIPHSS